jgi:hypothetical protein
MILIVAWSVIGALIGVWAATLKRFSPGWGMVSGFVFGPFSLLLFLVPGPSTRTCPHCAETVLRAARVCRFCGKNIPVAVPAGPRLRTPEEVAREAKQRRVVLWVLCGIILASMASAVVLGFLRDRAAKAEADRRARAARALRVNVYFGWDEVFVHNFSARRFTDCELSAPGIVTYRFGALEPNRQIQLPYRAMRTPAGKVANKSMRSDLGGDVASVTCLDPDSGERVHATK